MIVLLRGDRALIAQARRDEVPVSTRLLFGRFASELQSVTLSLKNVLAEGRTPTKRCQVVVTIKPKRIRVEHVDTNLAVALERASNKAARTIARVLQRERGP